MEIPEDADAQVIHSKADVEITWLPRSSDDAGQRSTLAEAVTGTEVPQDSGAVWFAAEASVARSVRRHFQLDRNIPRDRLIVAGYWKNGETDFRDSEGS